MEKFKMNNQYFQSIVNTLPIGIILTKQDGEIIFSNPKLDVLLGFNKDELLGCSIEKLVPLRYHQSHEKNRKKYLDYPVMRSMGPERILPALKKNGEEIQVKIGLTPLELDTGLYTIVSLIEITNQVFKIAAYHDPLTGLSNRNLFTELSGNLHNLAIRNDCHVSLMFIDLDDFKDVNDQYGHAIGDMVLCEVANILTKCVRKNDVVGRLGGDEFLIYLYDMNNSEKLENISRKIINKIVSIGEIKENKINISASIGAISTGFPTTVFIDEMIKRADQLMYKAKKIGKGQLCVEDTNRDL